MCVSSLQFKFEEERKSEQGLPSPSALMDFEDNTSFSIRAGPPDDDLVLVPSSPKTKKEPVIISPPNVKFSNFSASSLSDDRWICPICLDIYVDAVEIPCCNNLFC
jgi:hypothetical protein